ncbi:MAG: polyhydroxyalkanoic acid system family protein [Pirellulales bacterium]|jgi:hypothetical protein|nr:polyhydroxyalkanoic acid system family protein [Thermoguttaceae bacterium]MDD4788135.1 polyhydroxyalkanoic acid system family protein [Pirellulales bacterium]MDI9442606.1 polyhydroxyalkanoic acid system family protein [Planctomycetota bacterium]NLY99376.1 polyhydroxyalkanoic acid synthase [Pirellulaceae bacterium]
MPKLTIQIPHDLGKEEATRRLQQRFQAVKQRFGQHVSDFEEEWNGDSMQFGFRTFGLKISGQVESEAAGVKLSADLPMAAMMFRGTIEQQIRDELAEMLTG